MSPINRKICREEKMVVKPPAFVVTRCDFGKITSFNLSFSLGKNPPGTVE